MEKTKKKLIEVFTDKTLYIFVLITIIFFGIFSMMQFAPDTYSVFTNGLKETVMHFFSCGRFVTGISAYIAMGFLKLGNRAIYLLSYFVAMISTILSLYIINKLIKKDIKNSVVSILVSTLIIINPFSIELFLYIEKGIMMLSVLLCVLAIEQMDKYFQGYKKSILWAFILILIANCCYQGTVGLFVSVSLIYIIKYSKNIKQFIKNNIIVALVYGIPAIINFLSIRILYNNQRVNGNIILLDSINKVINGTKSMFINNYGLLPKYLFMFVIVMLSIIVIYKSIKKQSKLEQKILEILGMIYLIVGTWFATIAPQMMQDTNSIWFVARSSYSTGAIIGILMLYIFQKYEIYKNLRTIILITGILFLGIQLIYFNKYSIDGYIVNYEDKKNAMQIIEVMKEYEEKSGNTVSKIAFYKDKNPNYTYSDISSTGDINIKALFPDWSAIKLISYYSGRNFATEEQKEELKTKFEQQDWDNWNKEQIIFDNNIMHLCTY